MAKKKLLKLDKKTREKIKGFEELAETLMEDQIDRGTKISKEKVDDTFELYQFLETEEKRVERVNKMLTTKLENLKENSQQELLIERTKQDLVNQREALINHLIHEDNDIHQQMQEMFRRIF